MNAFGLDSFGNDMEGAGPGDYRQSCDWTYNPQAGSPDPGTSLSAISHTVTHNDYLDGDLICTINSQAASAPLYGGVSRIAANFTSAASPVVADFDNIAIDTIELYYQRGGVEFLRIGGISDHQIDVSTDASTGTATAADGTLALFNNTATNPSFLCSFNGSGICPDTYNFSLSLVESSRSITLQARGKQITQAGYDIIANDAWDITLNLSPLTYLAGQDISPVITVIDKFSNLTTSNCTGNVNISILDAHAGVSGLGATPYFPIHANVYGTIDFSSDPMQLVLAATHNMEFEICGFTENATIDINPTDVDHLLISKTDTYPAPADIIARDTGSWEFLCAQPDPDLANTDCGTLYAVFSDQYGNIWPNSTECDWTYSPYAGSFDFGMTNVASSSVSINHTDWFDGSLSCTGNQPATSSFTATVDLYGGLKSISLTHDYSDPITGIIAGQNNINITDVTLKMQKQGTDIDKEDAADHVINFSTTATDPANIVYSILPAASITCTFNNPSAGNCGDLYSFSFTNHEMDKSLTLGVQNKTVTIADIDTYPAPAYDLQVTNFSAAQVAGTLYSQTVEVRDLFGNYTDNGCVADLALSVAEGLNSPNNTAAIFANLTQSSLGIYQPDLTLYLSGTNTMTYSACGVNNSYAYSVTPVATGYVFLSNNAAEYPGYNQNEGDSTGVGTLYAKSNGTGNAAILCQNDSGDLMSSAVSCQTLYAYSYDIYGNINDSAPSNCDWSYATIAGAPAPTISTTASSYQVSHSDWIDGDLSCVQNAITASINTYGGVASFNAVLAYPNGQEPGGEIVAAQDNIQVTAVTLYHYQNGVQIANATSADHIVSITHDAGDPVNLLYDINPYDPSTQATPLDSIVGPPTCSFDGAGICPDSYTLSLQKEELNRTISLDVRGKSYDLTGTDIVMAPGVTIDTSSVAETQKVAGVPFNFTVTALDQFGNPSSGGCADMAGTIVGGGVSPDGSTPTGPNVVDLGAGQFEFSVTLVNQADTQIDITGCGGATASVTFPVIYNPTAGYTIMTTDSDITEYDVPTFGDAVGASIGGGATVVSRSDAGAQAERLCLLTDTTTYTAADVACDQLHVYGLDLFGNTMGEDLANDNRKVCSWAYTPYGASATPASLPGGAANTYQLSHDDYLDGILSCDITGSVPTTILTYGGVSRSDATFTHTADSSAITAAENIIADYDNIQVSNVNLYYRKADTEYAWTAGGIHNIAFSTTATTGTATAYNGTPATFASLANPAGNCTFAAATCASSYLLNLSVEENAQTVTATVRGKAVSSNNFNIIPNSGWQLTVTMGTNYIAGDNIEPTAVLIDGFGNNTDRDCPSVTPSVGGVTSFGGSAPNASATINMPSATNTAGVISFSGSPINVYEAGTYDLDFNICSPSVVSDTVTITVVPAPKAHLNMATVAANPAPADIIGTESTTGTLLCPQPDPDAADVTCTTIYALFTDTYGNSHPATDPCTWAYAEYAGAPALTMPGASNSIDITHTDWIDGRLSCNDSGLTANSDLYGGLKSIELTHDYSDPVTGIIAGQNNINISDVTLRMQKQGADVDKEDADYHVISFSTTATDPTNIVYSILPTASVSCSFNNPALGTCGNGYSFSFTNHEMDTTLTLGVQNKTVTISDIDTYPAVANDLQVTDFSAAQVAGTLYAQTVEVRDLFGNLTDNGCVADLSMSVAEGLNSPNNTAAIFANLTQSSLGVYQPDLTLFLSGTNTMTYDVCGVNNSYAYSVTPVATGYVFLSNNAAEYPGFTQNEGDSTGVGTLYAKSNGAGNANILCQNDNGDLTSSAISCQTLYAYSYDIYGNANDSTPSDCDWSYATIAGAPAPSVSATAPNYQVTHTDWIDGDLSCVQNAITANINTYGGVASFDAVLAYPNGQEPGGEIVAAQDNIQVTAVTLYHYQNGVQIANAEAADHIIDITHDAGDPVNLLFDINPYDPDTQATPLDSIVGPPTCSFAGTGICPDNYTLSFQLGELDRVISLGIRGKTFDLIDIDVIQDDGVTIDTSAVDESQKTAGVQFNFTVTALDQFGNPSSGGCADMAGTIVGGGISPDGSAPTGPTVVDLGNGDYEFTVTLVNQADTQIDITGCGGSASVTFPVIFNSTAGYTILTTDTDNTEYDVPTFSDAVGASLGGGATVVSRSDAGTQAERLCLLTDTTTYTSADVACDQLHVYGLDLYGNTMGEDLANDNRKDCSWTYTPYGASATPASLPGAAANTYQLTHNDYLDGILSCDITGSVPTTILTWGGVSRSDATFTQTADSSAITAAENIIADYDNIQISNVNLYYRKADTEYAWTAGGIHNIAFSTTATTGAATAYNGAPATFANPANPAGNCTFATATCASSYLFNLSVEENAQTVTATVRGKSVTTNSFNIVPNSGWQLAVSMGTNYTAGDDILPTATLIDGFGNLTARDCPTLTPSVSGATYSGDAPNTTATAGLPGVSNTTGNIVFTGTPINVYEAGTYDLDFNICSPSVVSDTVTITVVPAPKTNLTLSTVAANPTPAEVIGTESTTGTLLCPQPDPDTADVACTTIYVLFTDTYGNSHPATDPCTWGYAEYAGAPALTMPGASNSIDITHTDWIDGRLSCTDSGLTAYSDIYGGLKAIELTHDYSDPITGIIAGQNNINISDVTLRMQKQGADVDKEDAADHVINFSTTATDPTNIVYSILPAASLSCSFTNPAAGNCDDGYSFSFTNHEMDTTLTLGVQNKTVTISDIDTYPAVANDLQLTDFSAAQVAGTLYAQTVEVRDLFGNLTDNGCVADLSMSVAEGLNSPNNTAAIFANLTQSSLGVYQPDLTLFLSGTNTMTFDVCGVNNSYAYSVTPVATGYVFLSNNAAEYPGFTLNEGDSTGVGTLYAKSNGAGNAAILCQNDSGDLTSSAVSCQTLYAYSYDIYGNANDSTPSDCNWSYATIAGAPAPTVSATANNYQVTHTDWIDGDLSCVQNAITANINTYGGVAGFDAALAYPNGQQPGGEITAAQDNIQVTAVTLYHYQNGVQIANADAADHIIDITHDANDPVNLLYDINPYDPDTQATPLDNFIGPPTCSFAGTGICPDNYTLSFQREETGRIISLGIRGKTYDLTNIDVVDSVGITLDTGSVVESQKTAGVQFNFTVIALDEFGNPSSGGCADMAGTIVGGGISPDGSTPSGPTVVDLGAGQFEFTVTLVNQADTQIDITGCGGATASVTFPVIYNPTAGYTILTTDTDNTEYDVPTFSDAVGASLGGGATVVSRSDAGTQAERLCLLTDTTTYTSADVACDQLHVYGLDLYGNTMGEDLANDNRRNCGWAYTPYGSSTSPISLPGAAANTYQPTHNDYLDGILSCDITGSVPATILTWGGVSRSDATFTQTADSSAITTAEDIIADYDNIQISNVNLYYRKAGTEYAWTAGGIHNIAFSTTATTGAATVYNGAPATFANPANPAANCTFAAATCASSYLFNLSVEENAQTVTATVRGKSVTTNSFNIVPNSGWQLAVSMGTNYTAGDDILPTATLIDGFGNLTARDCPTLTPSVSGATYSGDAPNTTATAGLPGVSNTTGNIVFTGTPINVYEAGTYDLDFNICSPSVVSDTVTITVVPAPKAHLTMATVAANPAPADIIGTESTTGTLLCPQPDPDAADVTCSTIYALFTDTYGNSHPATDPCTWAYAEYAGAPALAMPGASNSIDITHTDWIDGRLSCTDSGLTANSDIYGGLKAIELTHDYSDPITGIIAGQNNINISDVTLRMQKQGADVDKEDAADHVINFSTTATDPTNIVYSILPAASISCTFATPATGNCNDGYSFSFTNHEMDTTLTLGVQNKTVTISDIDTYPAVANDLQLTDFSAAQVAGTLYAQTVEVRDLFGNLTDNGCVADLSMSVAEGLNSPNNTAAIFANLTQSSLGIYQPDLTLFLSGTNTMTFDVCGVNNSYAYSVTPVATGYVFLSNNAAEYPGFTQNEGDSTGVGTLYAKSNGAGNANILCQNDNGDLTSSAISCQTLYAYSYDIYGNINDSTPSDCDWSYATIAGAPAPTVSATANNYQVTHTDWIDGDLSCVQNAITASINTYGGVASFDAVLAYPNGQEPGGEITAAQDNIQVTAVTLYHYQNGVQIANAEAADHIIDITHDAGDPVNLLFDINPYDPDTQATPLDSIVGPPTCSFAGTGICPDNYTLSFQREEDDRIISLGIRGKTFDLTNIDVVDSAGAVLDAGNVVESQQTAGVQFNFTITAFDQFGNPAPGCADMVGTIVGGGVSPNGSTATGPTIVNLGNGDYEFTVTLVNAAATQIDITGCSGGSASVTFPVVYNPTAGYTILTTDTDTSQYDVPLFADGVGTNLGGGATVLARSDDAIIGEIQCLHGNSPYTDPSVTCERVHSFGLDAYGNPMGTNLASDNRQTCNWSYVAHGSSGVPATLPGGTASSYAANHTDYLDGNLTCDITGSIPTTVLTYGGVSEITATYNLLTVDGTDLIANFDNVQVADVKLFYRKNGVQTDWDFAGAHNLAFSTTATTGTATTVDGTPAVLWRTTNNPANQDCIYTTDTCPDNHLLSLSVDETGRTITTTVRGKTFTSNAIDVISNVPTGLTVNIPATVTAGVSFEPTGNLVDDFGNDSDYGCGSTTIAPSIIDGHAGVSPNGTNADINDGSFINGQVDFSADPLALYYAAAHSLQFDACGLSVTQGISVDKNSTVDLSIALNAPNPGPGDVIATSSTPGEYMCPQPVANDPNVDCPVFYAALVDAYGNSDSADVCTWTTTPYGSANDLIGGTGWYLASVDLDDTQWMDYRLTCDAGGFTTHLDVTGGITEIEIASYTAGSVDETNLLANNDNISITDLNVFYQKQGVKTLRPDIILGLNIDFSTDAANTTAIDTNGATHPGSHPAFISPASTSCDFNAGSCIAQYDFSFTVYEPANPNRTLTVSLPNYGLSDSIVNINVQKNLTEQLYADPVTFAPTDVAGVEFTTVLYAYDAFGNPGDSNYTCWDTSAAAIQVAVADTHSGATLIATPGYPAIPVENPEGQFQFTAGDPFIQVRAYDTHTWRFRICDDINTSDHTYDLVTAAVPPAPLDGSWITNTDEDPISTGYANVVSGSSSATTIQGDVECTMDLAAESLNCGDYYVFVSDEFGNNLDAGGTSTCNWSYSSNTSFKSTLSPTPFSSDPQSFGDTHSYSMTNVDLNDADLGGSSWIDGTLTCDNPGYGSTVTATVWGGVAHLRISGTGASSVTNGTIYAGDNNFTLENIEAYGSNDGVMTLLTTIPATPVVIDFEAYSGSTQLATNTGVSAAPGFLEDDSQTGFTCTFDASGICSIGTLDISLTVENAPGERTMLYAYSDDLMHPTSEIWYGMREFDPGTGIIWVNYNLVVIPAPAASLSIITPPASTMYVGDPVNVYFEVRDVFGNLSSSSCEYFDVYLTHVPGTGGAREAWTSGGDESPGPANGGTARRSSFAEWDTEDQAGITGGFPLENGAMNLEQTIHFKHPDISGTQDKGRYYFNHATYFTQEWPSQSIRFYEAGEYTITFAGCGFTAGPYDITAIPREIDTIWLSETDARPANATAAYWTSDDVTPKVRRCDFVDNSTSNISCGFLYAFGWDEWGNEVDPNSTEGRCDWQYTSNNSFPGHEPSSLLGVNQEWQFTTPLPVDGTLSCESRAYLSTNKVEIWTYGGVSETDVTADESGTIYAATDNYHMDVVAYTYMQGVKTPLVDDIYNGSNVQTWVTEDVTGNPADIIPDAIEGSNLGFYYANWPYSNTGSTVANIPFDLTAPGTNRYISLDFRGVQNTVSGINIKPGTPATFSFANIAVPAIAGTAYSNVQVEIRDQFGNLTDYEESCGVDYTQLSMSNPGNDSDGSHNGEVKTPQFSVGTAAGSFSRISEGIYQYNGTMTFYKAGLNYYDFTLCGQTVVGSASSGDLNVGAGTVDTVWLTTSATTPASGDEGTMLATHTLRTASSTSGEYFCGMHPVEDNSLNGDVRCPWIRAYAWDAYGNENTSYSCSWSLAGAAGPGIREGQFLNQNASSARVETIGSALDSTLTCSVGSVAPGLLVYGGVSSIGATHNYNGTSVEAATDNLDISSIMLYRYKNNVEDIALEQNGNNVVVAIATDSILGVPGINATTLGTDDRHACAIQSTGDCQNFYGFDLTSVESGRTITVIVGGQTYSITNINVTPAAVTAIINDAVSASPVVAGSAFTISLNTVDGFANLSENGTGCETLTITNDAATLNAQSSPGGFGGSIQAPSFGAGAASTATGVYTSSPITLYDAAAGVNLNANVCGITQQISVGEVKPTVSGSDANFIALSVSASVPSSVADGNIRATSSAAGELRCSPSASGVNCPTLYTHNFDPYGNYLNGSGVSNANVCDFSYTTHGGAPVAFTSTTAGNIAASTTGRMDGTISCTKSATVANLLVYGGAARMEILDTVSSVTAGNNNVSLSQVKVYTRKNNVESVLDSESLGAGALAWTSTSSLNIATVTTTPSTCTTDAAGVCSATYDFSFTAAENLDITATIHGVSASITGITINPDVANSLVFTSAPAAIYEAGSDIEATVQIQDSFGNPTDIGCNGSDGSVNATVGATSSGKGGGSALAPVLPSSIAYGSNGQVIFNGASVIHLYAKGSDTLSFSACGLTAITHNLDVTEANINNLILNTDSTDSEAADDTPHSGTTICPTGSTVSCNTIYAHAWDAYGNYHDGFTCPAWSYAQTSGIAAVSPSPAADSKSSSLSSSATHIDGDLVCTAGAQSSSANFFGTIQRSNLSWSCGNWSCNAGDPVANCTLTNNTGYDIASVSYTDGAGTILNSGCEGILSDGNACNRSFTGVMGNPSGANSVDSVVASQPSNVEFVLPSAQSIESGANAPNCSTSFAEDSQTAWTCDAGFAAWTATIRNDNDNEDSNFDAPSYPSSNGEITDTYDNYIAAAGGMASVTVHQATPGLSTTVSFNPSAGSYFQPIQVSSSTSSVNCTADIAVSANITQA